MNVNWYVKAKDLSVLSPERKSCGLERSYQTRSQGLSSLRQETLDGDGG